MTTTTSTVSDLLFLARQPERAGISFRRSHEERAIPRVGGSSFCCKRERIQSVCSVLLNALVDVWCTRKPGNHWRSRRSLSVIAFYHPPTTSVISIGSYSGLYNKLFAKRRECMCVFTIRALFVLMVTTRRSRGTLYIVISHCYKILDCLILGYKICLKN